MPQAAARRTKAPKAAKPKPARPAAVETSTVAKPELAGELRKIDVDLLRPSPYQTRRPPTEEWLIELGNSLRRDGQLTPCLVRPLPESEAFELIAGHTRTAAAKRTHWAQLECRIVQCDDATARRLVLIENAKRRDLDVIEQAQALKGLVDEYAAAGKSQRDLAADIGVSQSEISNAVRLLALPEVWQERLITGGITKTQARELLPWCDVADLWPALEHAVKQLGAHDLSREFPYMLSRQLCNCSRAVGWAMKFKPTPEQRAALDIRQVARDERAFNTVLWDELQLKAEERQRLRAAKQAEKTAGKVAAGKADPKKAAEQHNKRLYRWKVTWLQARIVKELEGRPEVLPALLIWFTLQGDWQACAARRDELVDSAGVKLRSPRGEPGSLEIVEHLLSLDGPAMTKIVRSSLQRWLLHPAEGYRADCPAPLVELLAEHLGIDIVRNWSLEREFLELLTTAQLQELATEWKLGWAANQKRSDLITMLAEHGKEKPCPKAVRGIKAVSLV